MTTGPSSARRLLGPPLAGLVTVLAIVAIVVIGPLLSLLIGRGLFHYLRSSTALARLVTTLGLLIAIPAAAAIGVLVRHAVDLYLDSPIYLGRGGKAKR